MNLNEFRTIYSPIFTDAWNFFKAYGQNPPDPSDDAAWRKISGEADKLTGKHQNCGRLNQQILLACIEEIERLSKTKGDQA